MDYIIITDCKGTPLSVETAREFTEFVEKIEAKKLEIVNVMSDMIDVEAKCAKPREDDGTSTPEPEEATQAANVDEGTSELEDKLAEFRLLLEAKYQTPNSSNVFDYKINGVLPLSLSPFLMREWAVAMHEGKATLDCPPHTTMFNPKSKCRSLVGSVPSTPLSATAARGVDITAMTGFVTAVADLMHDRARALGTLATLTKQAEHVQGTPSVSKIPPSPSDLHRCLSYIAGHPEFNLLNALQFEEGLRVEGYAPDIIPELDIGDLTVSPIKLKKGNARHLKQASEAWWKAPDGKHLRAKPIPALDVGSSTAKSGTSANTVRYERHWTNLDGLSGGAQSWFALPMQRKDDGPSTPPNPETDGVVYYRDEARGGEWVQVPSNYIIPEEVLDRDA